VREAQESLDAVRKPWYLMTAPFVGVWSSAMALALFIGAIAMPTSSRIGKWWMIGCFVLGGIIWFKNAQYRDKTWRRLIELEAPVLHRKINEKTDT